MIVHSIQIDTLSPGQIHFLWPQCPHTKVLIVYHNKFNTFYGTWYFSYKARTLLINKDPYPLVNKMFLKQYQTEPKILVEKSSLVFPKMAPFKLSQGKNTTPLKLAYMKDSTAFRRKS